MDIELFSKVKKGQIIPDFVLKSINGQDLGSDSFSRKKHLLLLFFNRLNDPCCARYLEMLNASYEELKREDTVVIAITQGTPLALKEFAKTKQIRFHILLDPERKVMDKFTYKDKEGNNIGALFIADKFNSVYKYYLHEPFGELPAMEELLSSVEFLNKQCPECGVSAWPEGQ